MGRLCVCVCVCVGVCVCVCHLEQEALAHLVTDRRETVGNVDGRCDVVDPGLFGCFLLGRVEPLQRVRWSVVVGVGVFLNVLCSVFGFVLRLRLHCKNDVASSASYRLRVYRVELVSMETSSKSRKRAQIG